MTEISVVILDRLYLKRTPELDEVFIEIRKHFTHQNPKYKKMKALGFWTGAIPRELHSWRHEVFQGVSCLSLPRGGTDKLTQILRYWGLEPKWIDNRLSLPPVKGYRNSVILRQDQELLVQKILHSESCLIRSPTGSGKCLGKSTRVIKWNGEIAKVEDIQEGDLLMGPDSQPRKVISVTKGHGFLNQIISKGKPWIANNEHILVLVSSRTGEETEISIDEFMKKSKNYRDAQKLFSPDTPLEFDPINHYPLPIHPYIFGAWFLRHKIEKRQRGRAMPMWVMKGSETVFAEFCRKEGIDCRIEPKQGFDPATMMQLRGDDINEYLRAVQHDTTLPRIYKCAKIEERWELLAGFIDASATYNNGCFEFIRAQREKLVEIQFVARSLGFPAYIWSQDSGELSNSVQRNRGYRLVIGGDVHKIPTRVASKKAKPLKRSRKVNRRGFQVRRLGRGEYYGFTLTGDGRFLLEDFTITHNTEVALKVTESILEEAGPVLIVVWETELAKQWVKRACIRFGIEPDKVGFIGSGIHRVKPITVAMQQSLWKKGRQLAPFFGGIIADEVQRFAARTYQSVMDVFPCRYRVGFSADETRRDGLEFLIYETFGHVAGEVQKEKLIVEGRIHEVVQRIVPTGYDLWLEMGGNKYSWRELPGDLRNYNQLLVNLCADEDRNDLIWKFMLPSIRAKKTLMVITSRVSHAKYWAERIRAAGITVGLMLGGSPAEFATTRAGLMDRSIQVAVGTNQKTGQGHDIPQWDRGFILTPLAGNKQAYEQLNGRLRRTCPGKDDAVNYYFWDERIYPTHKKIISEMYPETYIWVGKEFVKV